MRIVYDISDDEALHARAFFDSWRSNPFVKARKRRNVDGIRGRADHDQFWEALVSALLTTQQRSGPNSAVTRFISSSPFPLGLAACRANRPCNAFVEQRITAFGGIRRGRTIAGELESDLAWLEQGGWASVLPRLSALEASPDAALERETARYVAANLKGLGPKQARNVLQMLDSLVGTPRVGAGFVGQITRSSIARDVGLRSERKRFGLLPVKHGQNPLPGATVGRRGLLRGLWGALLGHRRAQVARFGHQGAHHPLEVTGQRLQVHRQLHARSSAHP